MTRKENRDFNAETDRMYGYKTQRGLCPAKIVTCMDKNDPPCERGCKHYYRCFIE